MGCLLLWRRSQILGVELAGVDHEVVLRCVLRLPSPWRRSQIPGAERAGVDHEVVDEVCVVTAFPSHPLRGTCMRLDFAAPKRGVVFVGLPPASTSKQWRGEPMRNG